MCPRHFYLYAGNGVRQNHHDIRAGLSHLFFFYNPDLSIPFFQEIEERFPDISVIQHDQELEDEEAAAAALAAAAAQIAACWAMTSATTPFNAAVCMECRSGT